VWSPDGEKITYCVREGGGFGQIQLMKADGSGHVQLTNSKGGACLPDWSPDGERMLFTALGGKTPRIGVMSKNGDNATEVIAGGGARWSPSGKQFVFLRAPEPHHKSRSIWIANADGTGARKVIEDDSSVLEINWDPDGNSIVFCSEREQHKSSIFRVNLDGTGLETIATDSQLDFFFPIFSPDRNRLLVDSFPHGSRDGRILLFDLVTHKGAVLAHGTHPSAVWEKQ
jgi:Tol biopolymer transport system component